MVLAPAWEAARNWRRSILPLPSQVLRKYIRKLIIFWAREFYEFCTPCRHFVRKLQNVWQGLAPVSQTGAPASTSVLASLRALCLRLGKRHASDA